MSRERSKTTDSVLAILRRHRRPVSAYDVLGELQDTNPKIAPPTIYRALAALMDKGLVRRVESLNAFMACKGRNRRHHTSIMSICDDCGAVEESIAPDLVEDLSVVIGKSGFEPTRHVIEVHGVCASCGAGRMPA
ncbi:MAG: Fur family transcriptional regulator [Pseudomonadota bacterium]